MSIIVHYLRTVCQAPEFGICNYETLKAEHTNSCWDCDQEVIFRYIKGVCRKLHVSGSCGEYRKKAIPVKCRKCSQMVYYVEHNGGSVWFNELGPPWLKHPCFMGEAKRVNVQSQLATQSAQPTEDYDRTARLTKRCEFCGATLKLTHYAAHLNSEHNKIIPADNFTQHKAKRNIKGTTPPVQLDRLGVVAPREPSIPSEVTIVLDKQGRRQCEFCTARVRPYNYRRHLAEQHGK